MNRRNFIQTTGLSAAAFGLSSTGAGNSLFKQKSANRPICAFTKCLQFLTIDQTGEALARMGFDGADMPVRPGGQIEPAHVKTELPKAVKSFKMQGVEIPMIVTAITSPDDRLTLDVLRAAADSGIKYYRTGWLKYEASKSIQQNLDAHRKTIENLAKINEMVGIHGDYQNHSGASVGSPVWDIYELLKNVDPQYMGVQYDIRHAVVEGAYSWKLGMQRVAPWIRTIDIKDFVWAKNEKGVWRHENVHLGKGMVNFDDFLKEYARLEVAAPVSIHYEYDLGGAETGKNASTMAHTEIFGLMKDDLIWVRDRKAKVF